MIEMERNDEVIQAKIALQKAYNDEVECINEDEDVLLEIVIVINLKMKSVKYKEIPSIQYFDLLMTLFLE